MNLRQYVSKLSKEHSDYVRIYRMLVKKDIKKVQVSIDALTDIAKTNKEFLNDLAKHDPVLANALFVTINDYIQIIPGKSKYDNDEFIIPDNVPIITGTFNRGILR